MSRTIIPRGYISSLGLYETQAAIDLIKLVFSRNLRYALNLKRVSAPLLVDPATGLNDNLTGRERPVSFDLLATGEYAEVVQSLAKWKRMALHRYGFPVGEGLYTDMNAIRRDEELSNLHSVYVDQWDWEKVITRSQRSLEVLCDTIQKIVDAICETMDVVTAAFPTNKEVIKRKVTFVTTQELERLYPSLTPRQREDAFAKIHKTVGLLQIGGRLESGERHDDRAPDYDDWSLNADIVFWNELLDRSFEISSMGIRVDAESLAAQLREAGCEERAALPFHDMLLRDKLPLTMGGGIGQSRLCMLLLGKAHIGEVHASVWDEETQRLCAENGIILL